MVANKLRKLSKSILTMLWKNISKEMEFLWIIFLFKFICTGVLRQLQISRVEHCGFAVVFAAGLLFSSLAFDFASCLHRVGEDMTPVSRSTVDVACDQAHLFGY